MLTKEKYLISTRGRYTSITNKVIPYLIYDKRKEKDFRVIAGAANGLKFDPKTFLISGNLSRMFNHQHCDERACALKNATMFRIGTSDRINMIAF